MTPRRSLLAAAALAVCSSPTQPVAPLPDIASAAPSPAPPRRPAPAPLPVDLTPCPGAPPAPVAAAAPILVVDAQHTGRFYDFEFDARGRLATANTDGSVRIWDLPTGALVNVIHQPSLGNFVKRVYWIGDHLALLGELGLNTMTVDVLGNVVAQNLPPRSSFADDPNPSNQDHALHLDMHGTRINVKVPDDLSPFAIHNVVTAHGVTAGTTGKMILIWRTPDTAPVRVTLGQSIEAFAIDPTGHTLAAGYAIAFDKPTSISLVDVRTGAVRKLPLTGTISSAGDDVLAFSPDGKRLAAAQIRQLLVWNVADGRQVARIKARDSLLAESGGRDFGNIMGTAWSPDGRWLVLASAQGRLDVFETHTLHFARSLGSNETRPFGVHIAGDQLLVAGPHSLSRWSIPRARLEDRAVVEGLGGFSLIDGDVVVAHVDGYSGECHLNEYAVYIDRWHGTDVPAPPDPDEPYSAPPRTTTWIPPKGARSGYGTARCVAKDRELPTLFDPTQIAVDDKAIRVYRAGAQAPVVLDQSPRSVYYLGASVVGNRAFALSGGGMGINNQLAIWSLATGKLERTLSLTSGQFQGVHWFSVLPDDTLVLGYGNQLGARALSDGRALWDLTLASPPRSVNRVGDAYVVGMLDGAVALVRGGQIVQQVHTSGGEVTQVTADPTTGRAATISADGSLRVWDTRPLRERVAFVSFEDGEWIAYTPGGAYSGTPEVADRVRWTFLATAESFRFEQFAATYDAPLLVERRAHGEDIDVTGTPHQPPSATAKLVSNAAGVALLDVTATSPTRVDAIRAYVEGRVVASARVCSSSAQVTLSVPITRDQRIAIAAFDDGGMTSNPTLIDARASAATRPDVWIVTAGVSHYKGLDAASQLDFAAADARAVSAAFAALAGPGKPYAAAHVVAPLVDDNVSIASIDRALTELGAMKPADLAVVFMSGHGIELASGAAALLTSPATDDTAVSWAALVQQLDKLSGRVLVLLDACHAGHLTRDRVVPNAELAGRLALASRAGVVVFAASKGRQDSYELSTRKAKGISRVQVKKKPTTLDAADGHGIFTDVLVRDLVDPATDGDGNGVLDIDEIVRAVTRDVSELTEGNQTPWLARCEMFGSFTVVPKIAH